MGQYTAFPIENRPLTDYTTYVYLTDFGVVGDGSTDDTAALNAAFASLVGLKGTVVWNVGYCAVTSTIIVGQDQGTGANDLTSFISIVCPNGQVNSGIKWLGSTSGEAMRFAKNKYCRVTGLGILNMVAVGTTIGLVLGGNKLGSGTQTLSVVFESCHVQGFNVGINAGGHNGAASEIAFNGCQINNCTTGFTSTDFNSLDFLFSMISMSGNSVGIDSGACSGFDVIGGSASFSSVADFRIQSNSTQTYIGGGFRSEAGTVCVAGSGGDVVIDKVLSVIFVPAYNTVTGSFRNLIIRDCSFDGAISPSVVNGILEVTGCTLDNWDTTRKLPVFLPTAGGQVLRIRGLFRNNSDTGVFPPRNIPDHQGLFGARSDGVVTVTAFYEPCITVIPIDQSSTTDFGTDYMALSHVRHLGEGTIPGATAGTAPTPGKNLRVQAVFATSNTIVFTFTRTLTVTSTGNPVVTATVGTFRQSDVGKKLFIDDGADTGADWYGYITEVLTPTTVNVFPSTDSSPGGRYPLSVGKTATVGENEPDANYMVAGLVGDANETFWITAIAATGFTFHSSNAASVATVTALIVR